MTLGFLHWTTAPGALILTVGASLVGLYTFDRFLANVEQSELQREARQAYRDGRADLRAGKPQEAVSRLQHAYSLVRGNRNYHLAFAEALMAAGDRERAEANLRDALARDSNDGRANLLMARLMAGEGRSGDANAYYHRAIYGVWHDDAPGNRLQTRLELADYLARQNRPQELLSELLILEERARQDPALARRVAQLFLNAGSPSRAVSAYRDILRQNDDDIAAWQGIGEAELRTGDFRAAQAALLNALRRDPSNPEVGKQLQFVNSLEQMDPSPRRLASREKYRRSLALLQTARNSLTTKCARAVSEEDARPALEQADAALASKPPVQVTNEVSESLISLAEQLWSAETRACPAVIQPDDPLALLMDKLKAQ